MQTIITETLKESVWSRHLVWKKAILTLAREWRWFEMSFPYLTSGYAFIVCNEPEMTELQKGWNIAMATKYFHLKWDWFYCNLNRNRFYKIRNVIHIWFFFKSLLSLICNEAHTYNFFLYSYSLNLKKVT